MGSSSCFGGFAFAWRIIPKAFRIKVPLESWNYQFLCFLRIPLMPAPAVHARMDTAGDGPHLTRPREPDGPCRQCTAPDGDAEGQRIAPSDIVQHASYPRPGGPTHDRCQHQRAK